MADRSRVYRSEAIVLRRQDLGEADRLITVFTPDAGKKRLVAKGVRRPGSKKAGHLEPFSRTRLLVARGRELDLVTQAEALDTYRNLRADLELISQAAQAVELVDRFGVEQTESQTLYDLLADSLARLDRGDDPARALRYFQIRLLDVLGYRPQLFACVRCGDEIQPVDQHFSAPEGGIVCPKHEAGGRPISLAALKVMRHYQRSPYEQAIGPEVSAQVATEVAALLDDYIGHFLERELRAPEFARQVRELKTVP